MYYLCYQLLYEHSAKPSNNCEKKLNSPLLFAIRYLHRNYTNPDLSLSMLSELYNYHPNYFCKGFKNVFGVSPMKCLQQIRIQKAMELLRNSSLSTEQIAKEVGFTNPTYLSILIKQKTGKTSLNYRN